MRHHTRTLITALAALLIPAPLAAQDTTDVQSLKQIRQRTGWQIDRLENLINEGQAALDHATHLYDAVDALVVRDSLRRLEPDTTVDDGHGTPEDTTTAPGDSTDDTTDTTDPDPEPSTGEPAVTFDPDQYASTEELLQTAAPFGGAELKEDGTQGRIVLDRDVNRPGGTQAMRYDYIDQGIGNSLHVGRRMPFPSPVREVWIEAQVRWSTNFFRIQNFPQDGSTFAHKFMFVQAKATATSPNWETSDGQSVGRWSILWPLGGSANPPNGIVGMGSPRRTDGEGGVADPLGRFGVDAANYFDGEWHTVRWHVRHDPGLAEMWVDGEQVLDATGFTIHPEVDMRALLLGRNKDDGLESGTESLWWGEIKAWTEDPGW